MIGIFQSFFDEGDFFHCGVEPFSKGIDISLITILEGRDPKATGDIGNVVMDHVSSNP
jgi:hypothetical protein